jgi:hypothetical protein
LHCNLDFLHIWTGFGFLLLHLAHSAAYCCEHVFLNGFGLLLDDFFELGNFYLLLLLTSLDRVLELKNIVFKQIVVPYNCFEIIKMNFCRLRSQVLIKSDDNRLKSRELISLKFKFVFESRDRRNTSLI